MPILVLEGMGLCLSISASRTKAVNHMTRLNARRKETKGENRTATGTVTMNQAERGTTLPPLGMVFLPGAFETMVP